MTITIDQIMEEAKKISNTFSEEASKIIKESNDRLDGLIKVTKYYQSLSKKHPGDFFFSISMESARLAIEKLEPDTEKAKEIFLELKLDSYLYYEEEKPKDKILKEFDKLASAEKIKDISKSLKALDIPFEDYHKTQLLSLLKDLKKDTKTIHNIFKNIKTEQYKGAILTLATYIEILLASSINYRISKKSKCSDERLVEYFSKTTIKAHQQKRIEIGKQIGIIDNQLYKRCVRFNENRNSYIHKAHLVKNGIFPYKLYADGRIIIQELEKIIFNNLPDYIKGQTNNIDELIGAIEKEFDKRKRQLLDNQKRKYELKK